MPNPLSRFPVLGGSTWTSLGGRPSPPASAILKLVQGPQALVYKHNQMFLGKFPLKEPQLKALLLFTHFLLVTPPSVGRPCRTSDSFGSSAQRVHIVCDVFPRVLGLDKSCFQPPTGPMGMMLRRVKEQRSLRRISSDTMKRLTETASYRINWWHSTHKEGLLLRAGDMDF
jgi:hypothetical protein